MLHFSKKHSWEDDSAVQQVLVFPSEMAKIHFDKKLELQEKTIGGFPDENNIGAVYKLRALKDIRGKWCGVIRCGITASLLYDSNERFASDTLALVHVTNILAEKIFNGLCEQATKIYSESNTLYSTDENLSQ